MNYEPLAKLLDLSGKRAIVTGGAMGIGEAIARRLSEAGARVMIADKDGSQAAALADGLTGAGSCSADVAHAAEVDALVEKVVGEWGGVDILVNNAGIYPLAPLLDAPLETFKRILDINLVGAFLCARAAATRMVAQRTGGVIINVTSIDALHPSAVGLGFYDASKHGLWGLTKSLALELAPKGIRVNAIAPGGVLTPGTGYGKPADPALAHVNDAFLAKIPMGRRADADEIARVALFLASDLSSYMTGAQVVVDGGTLLS